MMWALITPLFNLAIYTLVFGLIFRARWPGIDEDASTAQFALILFIGLSIHQIFSDMIVQSPNRILSHQSYVKKVVFPIEVLIPVLMGNILFNAAISFALTLILMPLVFGGFSATALFLPIVLFPLCLTCLGLGWFLSSLGTYFRDINQIMGPVSMAALFLAPIFFPASILPDWIGPWVKFNPITIPVEQAHNILIYGKSPDFIELGIYTLAAGVVFTFGYLWFQKTRKGFADVL